MNTEMTSAFILARLSSSRMPAKHFRHIGSMTMLEWVVRRLRQCLEIDEIIITTVAEPENEALRDFARKEGLACFWYEGNADHVTTRLRRAAEHYKTDICILVSGDCPLIYAPVIDEMLLQFKKHKDGDIFTLQNNCPAGCSPALYGIGIARKAAWQLADDLSDKPELKEHHFPVFGQRPELFNEIKGEISTDICLPTTRLFIDTYADLQFMNTLYDKLISNDKPFELPDVVNLLRKNPQLCDINRHVHQRQLIEDIKKVLFVIDAGGKFGNGHIMRSMEFAMQIVERLSWPVTFVVDDEQGQNLLQERGFRTICSALARVPNPLKKDNTEICNINQIKDYDLVIIDIADRPVPDNWRDSFRRDTPVIILDKATSWAKKADQIIIPGIICEEEKVKGNQAIISGKNHIIIRREIRLAAERQFEKNIDIVAYLPDKKRRKLLLNYCQKHSLICHIVEGGESDFPEFLARGKCFLGNYGYSFYEALYLRTFPIAWPISQAHGQDALKFYKKFELPTAVIENDETLEEIITTSRQNVISGKTNIKSLQDGTANIVEIIQQIA